MTNRWSATERIFHAALERPVEARAAFLAEACGNDGAASDVQSLLDPASCRTSWSSPPCRSPPDLVTSASLAPLTGQRLGVYSIASLLGRGGMGEVYRARDTRLGRDVAIKVLPRALHRQPRSARALRTRSARAGLAQSPAHRHVVRARGERRSARRSSSSWSRARRWPSGWRAGRVPIKQALTLGAADRRCPRCGARERHRAPRPETREREDHAAGYRQGAGLRPGADLRARTARPERARRRRSR